MPAVSSEQQMPKANNAERRAFYRVNDAVALKVHKLDSTLLERAKDRIRQREYELQVLNGKGDDNSHLQTAIREVEAKHPEVANVFRLLESRLDALANMVANQDIVTADAPNAVASMSGSGLGFDWPTAFYEGDHLMVELTLFPARYQIEAIATVVRGNPANRSTNGNFHCALEFSQIAAADRETLLQHIHHLQLQALRSRNDNDY